MKGVAQSRQADSLKLKQELYWKMLKEKEKRAREMAASGRYKEAVVVTYDSKGNIIESKKGGKVVTQTITVTQPILNRPFKIDTVVKDSIYIKVFKSFIRFNISNTDLLLYKKLFCIQ